MIRNGQVAAELGYLHLPRNFMTESDRWHDLPLDQLTFLTTGSQGEPLVGAAPRRLERPQNASRSTPATL